MLWVASGLLLAGLYLQYDRTLLLILAFVSAGFAFVTKYQGVVVVLCPMLAAAWRCWRQGAPACWLPGERMMRTGAAFNCCSSVRLPTRPGACAALKIGAACSIYPTGTPS